MKYLRPTLVAMALLLLLAHGTAASAEPQATNRQIEASVVDSQGRAIPNVTMAVSGTLIQSPRAGTPGRATLSGLSAGIYKVIVTADGFEPHTETVDLRRENSASITVTLKLATVSNAITVAATRTEQELSSLPVSGTVVDSAQIKQSAAVTADDLLRQVPTFSLFRRTSSLAAHPTAQGVSLRGIGPSGVSRTLVLIDGVPFNDPFGGWVSWSRAPLSNIRQVEVVDSSTSSVFGNYALGGTINLATEPPRPRTLTLTPRYGGRRGENLGVPGANVWDGLGSIDVTASDVWKQFAASIDGSYLRTNGYVQIPVKDPFGNATSTGDLPNLRGPIDTKATVKHKNLNTRLDYTDPRNRFSTTFRAGYFDEARENAKMCIAAANRPALSCNETNDTLWKYVSGGLNTRVAEGDLQVRVLANFETFHSVFLGITPRTLAKPSSSAGFQTVPSRDIDAMVQWSRLFGPRHYVTVGWDWRWVKGESQEDAYDSLTGTIVELQRAAGGRQISTGIFIQDLITVTSRLQLTLSARGDRWSNYDGHKLETALVSTRTPDNATYPDKTSSVASPHAGARYRISDQFSVWGALGWGFRAPTLNELYRQFAVGAVVTQANSDLGAERLFGGEAGFTYAPVEDVIWRATWFDNRFTNSVSNVTIATNLRQRQNLGRTRTRGVQTDLEVRLLRRLQIAGGYVYNMGRVTEFAASTALVGNLIPQVPKHRGSARLTYSDARIGTASISAQFSSRQFEDDNNTQQLPGYGIVDLAASRRISPRVEMFFDVQNLFNREFYVQRNPTTNGPPRLMTWGMRITLSEG
ncbi:MAG TPA: TonB-dependent receptor [Terriglobia bacterium]|nr:TonB-dependent receptor [Terriglobia bacterium]